MNGAMFFIHVGSGASVGGVEEVLDCLAAGCVSASIDSTSYTSTSCQVHQYRCARYTSVFSPI